MIPRRKLTLREYRKVKNNIDTFGTVCHPRAVPGTCTNRDCSRWLERHGRVRLAATKRPCVLCEANEAAAPRSGKGV